MDALDRLLHDADDMAISVYRGIVGMPKGPSLEDMRQIIADARQTQWCPFAFTVVPSTTVPGLFIHHDPEMYYMTSPRDGATTIALILSPSSPAAFGSWMCFFECHETFFSRLTNMPQGLRESLFDTFHGEHILPHILNDDVFFV